MNNKRFICEKTGTKMIAIREEDLDTLLMDLAETIVMVQGLASLIEKEDKLKKHHRPYLDVRKEMVETAGAYLERLDEIDEVIAEMPYGCEMECYEKEASEDEDKDARLVCESLAYLENEPEESSAMMETLLDLLDDLIVLTEYLDVQRHFVMLAQHDVSVKNAWKEFDNAMLSDITSILERWETYTGEKIAEFCI